MTAPLHGSEVSAPEPSLRERLRAKIPVRAPRFDFKGVPRHWFAKSALATHTVNALSLTFPPGERFFIRSVKYFEKVYLDDPQLLADVKGFIGQEGRHGHAHDKFNRMLEEQGYDVDRFLRFYERFAYDVIEPAFPPHLRLSTTAALEHLTATFAEVALRTDTLDLAHPAVAELLKWHAAEEIEHKSVAYDVLMRVDPRYSTRIAGLAIAGSVLGFFALVAFAMLMEQERKLPGEPGADAKELQARFGTSRARGRRMVGAAIRDYFRRDFHPDQRDNMKLAHDQIARMTAAFA
jgi:uncharacterized protein